MKKNKFYEQVSEDTFDIDTALLYKYATEYDCIEDAEGLADEIEDALNIAKECGEYWDDSDPLFPYNNYNWGFILDGYLFICDYTGLAGRYWNDNKNTYVLCCPY